MLATELAATRELLAQQAVHVERRRIAAELHDLVGHSLTVVLLSVTGARRLVRDDPEAATRALLEAEAVGRASLAEIRGSARALRDDQSSGPAFAPMPAARDLPELVAGMVSAGSQVDLDIVGDVDELEPVTGLVVYRVVQESLNNSARHAPGAPAHVAVSVAPEAVDIDVSNAGGAGHDGGPPGVGLVGMRERVESVGGVLEAGPTPGGWRVRAHVPRGRP
jgi:signal transduction histidine kinase